MKASFMVAGLWALVGGVLVSVSLIGPIVYLLIMEIAVIPLVVSGWRDFG